MNGIEPSRLSSEQENILHDLIERTNEKFETIAEESTNRAFNLGCSAGLLPAALVVLFSFLLSKGSWIAAVIASLLMVIALLGFASLVANIARSNTLERLYQQEILPEIERTIQQSEIDRMDFDHFVLRYLPGETLLGKYLHTDEAQNEQFTS